jgi:hypothetical protein
MIGRILATGPGVAAIAGNHANEQTTPEPLREVSRWLDGVTARLWDERASFEARRAAEADLAEALVVLRGAAAESGVSCLVWKRSSPFLEGNDHAPDLADLGLFAPHARVLLVTRDPRAAASSALRRSHHDHLRRAAVVCRQRWTVLAGQADRLDPARCRHLRYERFCADPGGHVPALARFAGLDEAHLRAAVDREGIDTGRLEAWRDRLPDRDAAELERELDEPMRAALDRAIGRGRELLA